MTGMPTLSARARASTLEPRLRMTSGSGPMKVMPAEAQASASSGFSDRKP
jgi:hypothetical protein